MTGTFMRKAVLPMLASLALCGTAAFAIIAGNARAQPEQRKPMMIALVSPGMKADAVAGMGRARPMAHGLGMPHSAEIAAHLKQMCQDGYARQAGALAYMEAKLSLTPVQQPLFAHWKQVKLDIAKRHADACPARARPDNAKTPTLIDRMGMREEMLKRRLADLDAERPALEALFHTLSAEQKREFGYSLRGRHPRMFAGGPGMMRPAMMGYGMLRHRPMNPGPMGAPGEAPPAPPPQ
jgi:hypothetical protein